MSKPANGSRHSFGNRTDRLLRSLGYLRSIVPRLVSLYAAIWKDLDSTKVAGSWEGECQMNRKRSFLVCAALMLSVAPGAAFAASDVFMCFSGVNGSSADAEFEGCSEIFGVSYSVGIEGDVPPPGGGAGGGTSQTSCGLYQVSKPIDRSSVPILLRSLLARRTAEVEFATRTRGAEPLVFFRLILTNVIIVAVEQNLAAEANAPVEKIVLQPGGVVFEFTPQDADGGGGAPISRGFDCVNNRRL